MVDYCGGDEKVVAMVVVAVVGYCWRCECGGDGDGFCKGGYFIVVGVLYLSTCMLCHGGLVVLVGL